MTTKTKLELLRLEIAERRLLGCRNELGDSGRSLKAGVYADVLRRHPRSLKSGRFGRVVRAVNNLLGL